MKQTMTDIDHQAVWERYASSWKALTEAEKLALFDSCLADNCVYTDPQARVAGWSELARYMLEFHQQIPGGHFVTRDFQAHHGRSIARWEMMNGQGERVGEGISYGEYDEAGRLTAMTGFF